MRSSFSNIWHASSQTLTTSVMARDTKKTYATSCPSYGLWFERFMIGMHKRMGDKVHQDKAITLAVIHKVVESLETEYESRRCDGERETIVNVAVFVLASFLVALRGEETLKIILGETRNYFEESQGSLQHKHAVLPLRGTFKGENSEGFHFVTVSSKTNSGLRIGPWVKRGIDIKEKRSRRNGFFFADQHNR